MVKYNINTHLLLNTSSECYTYVILYNIYSLYYSLCLIKNKYFIIVSWYLLNY